jgi:hypothetical protein
VGGRGQNGKNPRYDSNIRSGVGLANSEWGTVVRICEPREWYLQNLQKRCSLRKTCAILLSRIRLGQNNENFFGISYLNGRFQTNFKTRRTKFSHNLGLGEVSWPAVLLAASASQKERPSARNVDNSSRPATKARNFRLTIALPSMKGASVNTSEPAGRPSYNIH